MVMRKTSMSMRVTMTTAAVNGKKITMMNQMILSGEGILTQPRAIGKMAAEDARALGVCAAAFREVVLAAGKADMAGTVMEAAGGIIGPEGKVSMVMEDTMARA
jgi:hypothetical protein